MSNESQAGVLDRGHQVGCPALRDANAECNGCAKRVPVPQAEKQPEKGDGASVVETKMALPLSDTDRLAGHHKRIEQILHTVALNEKISVEAAYKWAADLLESIAELPPGAAVPGRTGLRWGRVAIALGILVVAFAVFGRALHVW